MEHVLLILNLCRLTVPSLYFGGLYGEVTTIGPHDEDYICAYNFAV